MTVDQVLKLGEGKVRLSATARRELATARVVAACLTATPDHEVRLEPAQSLATPSP